MRQVSRAIAEGRFARAGQTTQLVVGAAGEADREVARAAAWAYGEMGLARVYYSAMQPVPGTPVADRPPVAFGREHRLYQVDFLLRSYGFSIDEIEFDSAGALPLDVDPKTAWARRHPERFPVEINTAARGDLLRVPGIGPGAAKRLEQMRREHRLRDIAALRAAGASWKVASPFVLLDGKPAERQMSLWQ
jgi:predicted DNA-binding helix-hairpin-helix protein